MSAASWTSRATIVDSPTFGQPGEAEARGGPALVHDAAAHEGRVLLVDDDGKVEHRGVLERAAHEHAVRDGLAVVGDGDDALGLHRADLGELDALEALRDGADREDADERRSPGCAGRRTRPSARRRATGMRVRHRADGREAARGRGARAGRDRLLVLEARLAEVRVQVDEARRDDEARGVDDLGPLRRAIFSSTFATTPSLQEDVERLVEVARRVDDAAAPEEDGASLIVPLAPIRRYRTAIRTATPFSTWSRITESGPSATAESISTPRFIGPGVHHDRVLLRERRRSGVRPNSSKYSRSDGKPRPPPRSFWTRRIMTTSAPSTRLLEARHDARARPLDLGGQERRAARRA